MDTISNTQDYSVNTGEYQILNMRVVEKAPPNSPFAALMGIPGAQTTPSLGRGNLKGSAIALMNANLEHACDFKFMFTIDISAFGLINPVEEIQKALRNAKLAATNQLRDLLSDLLDGFRTSIDAILSVLGMDPSGALALQFQISKDLIDKVNTAIKKVAAKVEQVMAWIYFAQEIQQLVNWIKTLPAKLQALLANCLSNFNKSIKQIANTFESIPNQIINATQSQINTVVGQFTQAAQDVANAAQGSLDSASSAMPEALYQALMAPTPDTASALSDHIQSNTTDASTITQTAADHQTAVNSPGG